MSKKIYKQCPIGIKESVFDRLKQWKNERSLLEEMSSFSYSDAIDALLDDSDLLSKMKNSKK